jgi:tRNA-splicing ligase RtcB
VPKPFETDCEAVNCHHNYVAQEKHLGQDVLLTRKGAVSAKPGELGIIPGSMGAKSFIVRGKGGAAGARRSLAARTARDARCRAIRRRSNSR